MKRFRGNDTAGSGVYFNPRQFSFHSIERGDRLPGAETDEYLQVPWVVLLLVGPVLGLAYVVFLPFIGCALVAWLLIGKARDLTTALAHRAARVARPGWEPSMAYLSRSRSQPAGEKAATPAPRDAWSEEVHEDLGSPERTAEPK